MATAIHIVLFISIYLLHVVSNSASGLILSTLPCTYPKGSLSCKKWKYTNMDCSYRNLDCIPPIHQKSTSELLDLSHNKLHTLIENAFDGFYKLRILNVSSNLISTVHVSAFTGLDQLFTLDLSSNYITSLSDDGFKKLHNLQILYLNDNHLSSIGNRTFYGLSQLKTLDLKSPLSWNKFNFKLVPGSSPFQYLSSLQTLFIQYVTITPATFVGTVRLKFLDILVHDMTTDAPFTNLSVLEYLRVYFKLTVNCSYFCENLFTGLDKLEYLRIDFLKSKCYVNITFCPLVSLKSLHLPNIKMNMSNACLQIIPLTSLDISLYNTNSAVLQMFKHLSNLVYREEDGYEAVRALNLMHIRDLNLTTTSFKSWPKWKESLLELTILPSADYGNTMWIVGSPFQWFTKLKILRIRGIRGLIGHAVALKIRTLSTNVFQGLESLTELHVTYTSMPSLLYQALGIFGKYNSLLVLDLSHNQMYHSYVEVLDEICPISSLEKVYLLSNGIRNFYLTCTLPNLKILHMQDQNLPQFRPASLNLLCNSIGPNLTVLDVHYVGFVTFFGLYGINCPELFSLNVAQNKIIDVVGSKVVAPRLQELNLTGISVQSGNFTAIKLLTVFNTSSLRIVDLSSCQVSHIDQGDVILLVNLIYLDLRNNQITSFNYLQYLRNVKVLLIGGNSFPTVPNSVVSTLPLLNSVDLQDNVFECDCNIEEFQKWILTDKKVYLWNNASNGNHYKCDAPASRKGFSITEIGLDCGSYLITHISVSAACTVLALITLGILVLRYRWHIHTGCS